MNIALCFCVKNCEKYLPSIFSNIERLKTLDINVFSIFVYDNCSDNSEKLLQRYKKTFMNTVLVRKISNNSPYRTVRIAKARNACLDIIYNVLNDIKYHIMIDCDDVSTPKWNIEVINNYLTNYDNDNWDCISFNRPIYYDIWALLYGDIKHHCLGFGLYNRTVINSMQQTITNALKNCETNSIEVISAFNGFCIYKTNKFKGLYYTGLYATFKALVSDEERAKTRNHLLKFNNINTYCRNDSIECCEHLSYHMMAQKRGCKIKVSKFSIV